MRIAVKEFLKLIRHPMLWCMTVIFLLYNLILIYGAVGDKDAKLHFHSLHDTILAYGINLNEPNPNFNRTEPMAEFYLDYVEHAKTLYDDLNMYSILEHKQTFFNYHPDPNGLYQKFLRNNYRRLQKRLEEIKATGEADYGFYPGTACGIHSLLYGRLMRPLMLEMALLMILSVLYLMDYERMHKTHHMVITTRLGKGVMYRKIPTGIGTGLLCNTCLAAGSFGFFFHCVPFQGLWNVPVATALMAEVRAHGYYPFITFRRLTVGSYFALYMTVLALLLMIVGMLTAAVQLLLQNSYFTFLLQTMLYMVLYLAVPGGFANFLDVLICLNPSALWIASTCWFMENEVILSFAGNEFWCIGLWAVIAALGLLCGKRHYKRLEFK